jgi:hypothetical protein
LIPYGYMPQKSLAGYEAGWLICVTVKRQNQFSDTGGFPAAAAVESRAGRVTPAAGYRS